MNGRTCKLLKRIINGVQAKDNGEINTAEHNYAFFFLLYEVKGLNN